MMPRQPAKVAQRPAARCQIRQYILEDERTISGMFVQPLLIPEEVFCSLDETSQVFTAQPRRNLRGPGRQTLLDNEQRQGGKIMMCMCSC